MRAHVSELKKKAADYAVQFVEPGMVVGLGHGSTAMFAIHRIAEFLESGRLSDIRGIPCSIHVEEEARRAGIPLATLDEHPVVDVTIDGADEVTERCEVIKGGGGALLREKMVAQASTREIIVVDESKLTARLGTHWSVPVEVIPFGWRVHLHFFESLGVHPTIRKDGRGNKYITDQGNYILDCHFGPIKEPEKLAAILSARAGVVEHGLFLGLVTDVIIAGEEGIRHITASSDSVPGL